MSSIPMDDAALPRSSTVTPKPKKKYVRAVGPRLRKLLYLIFVLVALLFANSGYLSIVTFLEWFSGKTYQDFFYQYMFLAHLVLGLAPDFAACHFWLHPHVEYQGPPQPTRRANWLCFAGRQYGNSCPGILLVRIGGFDLKQPLARNTVYWLHVACPLAVVWLYWLHRLAGPRIKWRIGMTFAAVAVAAIAVMVVLQMQDPRPWNAIGPDSGVQYFEPSLARTVSGNFIPAEAMMNDDYCLKCHADIHRDWQESVHHFSSFNNRTLSSERQCTLERCR